MFSNTNILLKYWKLYHTCFQLLSSRGIQNGADNEGIWGFLLKDIKAELTRGSTLVCYLYIKQCVV